MSYNVGREVAEFIDQNKKWKYGYILLSLSFPLGEVALPHFYGRVVEKISETKDLNKLYPVIKGDVWIIVGLWAVDQAMTGILSYLDAEFVPALQSHIRNTLIEHVLDTYREDYQDPQLGDIISKIVKLPAVVRDFSRQMIIHIFPVSLSLLATVGYFFYIDRRLGILSLFGAIFFGIMIHTLVKDCLDTSSLDKEFCDYHESIEDTLDNLINVYAAGASVQEMERLKTHQAELDKSYSATIRCSGKYELLLNTFYFGLLASVNGLALHLYRKKLLSLQHITSILIIMLYVISSLRNVTKELREIIYNIGTIQHIQKYINELPPKDNSYKLYPEPDLKLGSFVEIENLTFRYPGQSTHCIENFNLSILPNELVCITGKNGAGKSTLIKLIMKYLTFESGDIKINGVSIQNIDTEHLRRKIIAYSPQEPKLFNRSVEENIFHGTGENIDASNLPFSTPPQLGKGGSKISGGQRQYISLMKCAIKKCGLVILDEPTSYIDVDTKKDILQLIQRMKNQRTIIIVSHDPDVISLSTKVVRM